MLIIHFWLNSYFHLYIKRKFYSILSIRDDTFCLFSLQSNLIIINNIRMSICVSRCFFNIRYFSLTLSFFVLKLFRSRVAFFTIALRADIISTRLRAMIIGQFNAKIAFILSSLPVRPTCTREETFDIRGSVLDFRYTSDAIGSPTWKKREQVLLITPPSCTRLLRRELAPIYRRYVRRKSIVVYSSHPLCAMNEWVPIAEFYIYFNRANSRDIWERFRLRAEAIFCER